MVERLYKTYKYVCVCVCVCVCDVYVGLCIRGLEA